MHRVAAGLLAAGILVGTLASSAGAVGLSVTSQEKAQARQALLVLSDFPKGWTSSPNSSSTTSLSASPGVGANAQMARCLGVSPSLFESNPAQVQSPTFTDSGGKVLAFNSIAIFRSTSFAHNASAALSSPKAARCLAAQEDGQGSIGATGAPPPKVSLKKLHGPKGTVSFELSSSGGLGFGHAFVSFFFFHKQFGDAVAALSFSSGTNVQQLAQRLLSVAHARL